MLKNRRLKIINSVQLTSPCPNRNFKENAVKTASGWFCGECEKNVIDFSKHSAKEILIIVNKSKGKVCAYTQRRPDGSVVTKEPISPSGAIMAGGLLLTATAFSENSAIAQPNLTTWEREDSGKGNFEIERARLLAETSSTPELMYAQRGPGIPRDNLRNGGLSGDWAEPNFGGQEIHGAVGNLFMLIEGAFGALTMLFAVFAAMLSAAFRKYKTAKTMLAISIVIFIARILISFYFGDRFDAISANS